MSPAVTNAVAHAIELARVPVTDADSYQAAGKNLQVINGYLKALDEHRKSLTRPLDETKRGIMELFAPSQNELDDAVRSVKRSMADWHAADLRAKAEAERIAREAQEEERRRLEAEAKAAEAEGDIDLAMDKTFEASMVATPILAPQTPKVTGISHRETWHAEVTSLHSLVAAAAQNPQAYLMYLTPNMQALNSVARTQKAALDIPGVKPVAEQGIAAGRR